jgi:hypothetical protein
VFEEVGVLAADAQKEPMTSGARGWLVSRRARKAELCRTLEAKVYCDLSPSHSPIGKPGAVFQRFDTRFFVAALPEGQTPLPTSYEVVHGVWLTPDRAMQLFNRGELPMIFPTFASLRTLADFETIESVFKEFRSSHAITP